ncbi:unnamed protein product [Rhizophagus irregularis]|nr:unnamed protein product [Rhizophagus irregularis]
MMQPINALGWKLNKPSDFAIKATGNFTRIDNGEPEPMLCLVTWESLHYPTFSKAPEVEDPPKEDQDQVSTDSSNPTSEEDLKKSVKSLKSD